MNSTNTVVEEFMKQRIKNKGYVNDFGPELSRLFLERKFYKTTKYLVLFYKYDYKTLTIVKYLILTIVTNFETV